MWRVTGGTENVKQWVAILKCNKRRNKGLPHYGSITTVQAIHLYTNISHLENCVYAYLAQYLHSMQFNTQTFPLAVAVTMSL